MQRNGGRLEAGPKISIITAVFNNAGVVDEAIDSVLGQSYPNLEYIVVDGGSTDGTAEKIQAHSGIHQFVSEPDRGLYDAINKGISLSTGDYVGLVHSDDRLAGPRVLASVAAALQERATDTLFGDVVFVDKKDRVVRIYRGRNFRTSDFARGMMPPHPTFYAKRELFSRFGGYDLRWRIASDFELTMRFLLVHGVSSQYLPLEMVRMRMGGASTRGLRSNITINREILEACRFHGVPTNYMKIYSKYLSKIWQFLPRGR